MEHGNDVEMESDSEKSCAESNTSDMLDLDEKIVEVKKSLLDYDKDVNLNNNLIEYLRKNGDFEELEEMEKRIVSKIALTPENYLQWIKNKRENNGSNDEIEEIFKFAFLDWNDVHLWTEYIFFKVNKSLDEGIKVCEEALCAIGTRYDIGGKIWLLYLTLLKNHRNGCKTIEDKEEETNKILNVYKRALRIPLACFESIHDDAKEFLQEIEHEDAEIETIAKNTENELKKIENYELELEKSDKTIAYQNYLEFEIKKGDMGRIKTMHERILEEYWEDELAWNSYGTWCHQELKDKHLSAIVYKKAIRHCPYSCLLHQQALLAYERVQESEKVIDEVWQHAKINCVNTADDGRGLYRTFIYLLRRRIAKTSNPDYSPIAQVFEEGATSLSEWFSNNWDPKGEYRQNQAWFYAANLKNMEKCREVWSDILASGFGKFAQKWIEAVRVERQFGDLEQARKYLNKALNSVSDNIHEIYEFYVQFEREEGTLEQLEKVLEKVNAQVAHRASRPQKKIVEPVKPVKKEKERSGPSKRAHNEEKKPANKRVREENGESIPISSGSEQKDQDVDEKKRTVFVSNLDFATTEDDIKKVLEGVENVRFAQRVGKSDLHRGFGYVLLKSLEATKNALKLDRTLVNGRPMFISENDPEKRVGFKYATGLEKTKIFVRNVHFKATEEEIKEVFSQFGPVTNVRLVRHKSGQPKGVAYVDFETEEGATKTLNAEKITLKERDLIVALSNPPAKGEKKNNPKNDIPTTSETRRGHAGLLQLVPRGARSSLQKKSNENQTENGTIAPKPMSNDMFRQFFKKS